MTAPRTIIETACVTSTAFALAIPAAVIARRAALRAIDRRFALRFPIATATVTPEMRAEIARAVGATAVRSRDVARRKLGGGATAPDAFPESACPTPAKGPRPMTSDPAMTPDAFQARLEQVSPYHDAQRRRFFGLPRETRAEYAARVATTAAREEMRQSLMSELYHSPGAVLDALGIGSEYERDIVIRLWEQAGTELYRISSQVSVEGESGPEIVNLGPIEGAAPLQSRSGPAGGHQPQ